MSRAQRFAAGTLAGLCLSALGSATAARACTTVLIGRALTADGSVIHAHNEDMGNQAAGRVWWTPPRDYPAEAVLRVPYVELAQAKRTLGYWASGNVEGAVGLGTSTDIHGHDSVLVGLNEHGVSMSCNWAHSREENLEARGIRRYAIRQILLERATSARHGVEILGELIDTYGQADWGGLIYHLADPVEAWVVETTTHNWVARRVRDDEIRVTANRFRIGSDYDLASKTLVRQALENGWLAAPIAPTDKLDFARVYGRPERMDEVYDTRREERAEALLAGKRGAIVPGDLLRLLGDRYEGTRFYTPPQAQPVWREDLAERPDLSRTISTNLAQSTFVAHLRSSLPPPVGAMMWLGLGTPSYAAYVPLYAAGGPLPPEYLGQEADSSAWALFRRLQRRADLDYRRSYPAIQALWNSRHALALERQRRVESEALTALEAKDHKRAVSRLEGFTFGQAADALDDARRLLELHPPTAADN